MSNDVESTSGVSSAETTPATPDTKPDEVKEGLDAAQKSEEALVDHQKDVVATINTANERKDLQQLQLAAIPSSVTEQDQESYEASLGQDAEKEGFFKKAGQWFKEHKKPLIVGGSALILTVLVWNVFKRRKRRNNASQDSNNGNNQNSNEGGSKFLKALKRAGIGSGAYLLAHGLYTGRWFKDIFNWKKQSAENKPEDLKKRFESLPEEKKAAYNSFGQKINEDSSLSLDKSANPMSTILDVDGKEKTMPSGVFPAKLDAMYANVGEIIGGKDKDNLLSAWDRSNLSLKTLILNPPMAAMGALKMMLNGVKGFTADMIGSDNKPTEKMKAWLDTPDAVRDAQVANLMGKLQVVRSYLLAGQNRLLYKYAKDLMGGDPTNEEIKDYIDKHKDTLHPMVESTYLSKKIVGNTPAESAYLALQEVEGVKTNADQETELAKEQVEGNKKKVIGSTDVLQIAQGLGTIEKGSKEQAELLGIANRFQEHLREGFLEENFFERVVGALGIDEIRNAQGQDIREAMKDSAFIKRLEFMKKSNVEFLLKLQQGKATGNDVKEYNKLLNEYFEQELHVLNQGIRMNEYDERNGGNFWKRGSGLWETTFNRVCEHPTAGAVLAIGGFQAVKYFGFKNVLVYGLGAPVTLPLNLVSTLEYKRNGGKLQIDPYKNRIRYRLLKSHMYPNTKDGYTRFIDDFKKGRISPAEVQYLFDRRGGPTGKWSTSKTVDLFNTHGNGIDFNQFTQYGDDIGRRSLLLSKDGKNAVAVFESIEKQFATLQSAGDEKVFSILKKIEKSHGISSLDDLKKLDEFLKVVDTQALSKIDDVSGIAKHITKTLKSTGVGQVKTVFFGSSLIDNFAQGVSNRDNAAALGLKGEKAIHHAKLVSRVSNLDDALKTGSIVPGSFMEKIAKDEITVMQKLAKNMKNIPEKEIKMLTDIAGEVKISSIKKIIDAGGDFAKFLDEIKAGVGTESALKKCCPNLLDDFMKLAGKNQGKVGIMIAEFGSDFSKFRTSANAAGKVFPHMNMLDDVLKVITKIT